MSSPSEPRSGVLYGPIAARNALARPIRTVAVFEEAPDLLGGLGEAESAELMTVRTPVVTIERGEWRAPAPGADAHRHFGLLVLDGVMLRRLSLSGRTGAELLGGGDLLQPWIRQPPHDTVLAEPGWEILERTTLAVLDHRFAARVAAWPEVAACLMARATERARMLAFQHVASHIPGLNARLVVLMWALADRWGRVTRDGVLVPLRLTHATLSELVGASRPSVSTALSQLGRDDVIRRVPSGWLLDKAAAPERVAANGARVAARSHGS